MALLNYSTEKSAEDSISEIQRLLAKYDVTGVMTEYEGRQVSAVAFQISVGGRKMAFRLPCNWRAVQVVLQEYNENRGYRKSTYGGRYREKRIKDDDDQAIRVAWRIIKDWVEAQMALVDVNMATVPQIFLPYAIMKDDRTLAEHVSEDPGFLLGSGA